jgi:hypothetical protein
LTERSRILLADGLTFLAPEPYRHPAPIAEGGAALSVAASQMSPFQKRILHLKVLEGGRKD